MRQHYGSTAGRTMRSVTLPNQELLPEVAGILAAGSRVTLRAKGNSMLPFIRGGKDSVVLKKSGSYRVGDVVLAEIADKQYILHRVMKVEGERVTLMGDGILAQTEECLLGDIHGRVIAILRQGREYDCNSGGLRFAARAWGRLLPVRRYLLAIYRRLT